MTKRYRVEGRVTAPAWVVVTADSEEEALDKAVNGGWGSGVGVEVGELAKGSFKATGPAVGVDVDGERTVTVLVRVPMLVAGPLTHETRRALADAYAEHVYAMDPGELTDKLEIEGVPE